MPSWSPSVSPNLHSPGSPVRPLSPLDRHSGVRRVRVDRSVESQFSSLEGWSQESQESIIAYHAQSQGYEDLLRSRRTTKKPRWIKRDGATWEKSAPMEATLFGKRASVPRPSDKTFGAAVESLSSMRRSQERDKAAITKRLTRSEGFLVPPESSRPASGVRKIRGPQRPVTAGSRWPLGHAVVLETWAETRIPYEPARGGTSNRPASALPSERHHGPLPIEDTGLALVGHTAPAWERPPHASPEARADLEDAQASKIALRVIEVRLNAMQRPATSSPRHDDWRPLTRPRTSQGFSSPIASERALTNRSRPTPRATPRDSFPEQTPREADGEDGDWEGLSASPEPWRAEGGAGGNGGEEGAGSRRDERLSKSLESSPSRSPPQTRGAARNRPTTAPAGGGRESLATQAIEQLRLKRIQRQESKMLEEANKITKDLIDRMNEAQNRLRLQTSIELLAVGMGCVRTSGEASLDRAARGGSRGAHSIQWWVDKGTELAEVDVGGRAKAKPRKLGKQIDPIFLQKPE